jgi:hypothetical protein
VSGRKANKNIRVAAVYAIAGTLLAIPAAVGYPAQSLWGLLVVATILFPVRWLYKRNVKWAQLEVKKREEERFQAFRRRRELEDKEWEERRIREIFSHEREWGSRMCEWLVAKKIDPFKSRTLEIMNKLQEWGEDTCQVLLERISKDDMSVEMVRRSSGEPWAIAEKVVMVKGKTVRWIYGTPRQAVTYVKFRNGHVIKTQR